MIPVLPLVPVLLAACGRSSAPDGPDLSPGKPGDVRTFASGYPLRFVGGTGGAVTLGAARDPSEEANDGAHQVSLSRGYWIGEVEVSQALWASVVGDKPPEWAACARFGAAPLDVPELPMMCVTWCEGIGLANALSARDGLKEAYPGGCTAGRATWDATANGYRLPTEAEWEWAAHGAAPAAAPTCADGNLGDASTKAALGEAGAELSFADCDDGNAGLAPVGSDRYPADANGLRDMVGNVWEWTWDVYADAAASGADPTGPSDGPFRVYRGGSAGSAPDAAGVTVRAGRKPDQRGWNTGLRLARSEATP